MGNFPVLLWLFLQLTTPPGVRLQDEGTLQGQAVTLNCVGSSIACAVSGGVGTMTLSAGGAGNFVEVDLDFTASGGASATKVVTGQAWVTSSSIIVCTTTMIASSTRAEGAEDPVIEALGIGVYSRVVGTGFTVYGAPVLGKAYGIFKVHCTGA